MIKSKFQTLPCGPNMASIYFLMRGLTVIYVGKSRTILNRVSAHKADKDFTDIKFINVPADKVDIYEGAFIRHFRPELNKTHQSKITPEEISLIAEYVDPLSFCNKMPAPKLGDYGPVAFYEYDDCFIFADELADWPDAILCTGIYDDDDTEDHDEDCEFELAKKSLNKMYGENEVPDDIYERACDLCKCEPKAVVRCTDGGSYIMPRHFLLDLQGGEDVDRESHRGPVLDVWFKTMEAQYGVDRKRYETDLRWYFEQNGPAIALEGESNG